MLWATWRDSSTSNLPFSSSMSAPTTLMLEVIPAMMYIMSWPTLPAEPIIRMLSTNSLTSI